MTLTTGPAHPRFGARALALTLVVALVAALVAGGSGCAISARENRRLVSAIEDNLLPAEQGGTRALVFVLLLPVGLVAAIADAVLIHPFTVLDDAWRDTRDGLWRGFNWDTEYVTEVSLFPLRVVFTPVLYGVTWTLRAMFDLDSHEAPPPVASAADKEIAGPPPALARLRELRAAGDMAALVAHLKSVPPPALFQNRELLTEALEAVLVSNDARAAAHVLQVLGWMQPQERDQPAVRALLGSTNALIRLLAMPFIAADFYRTEGGLALSEDPDPVVRFFWIDHVLGNDRSVRDHAEAIAALRRTATDDPVESVRVKAAESLRELGMPLQ